ncbi:MAG TPA: efflux RND transporter periplasmic adaptor subunit [Steroidobacteraceae bacterium]|nr:efflux RND transporter periplasmic adaptor subunit [Steroidobacteraceae bacterium]
MDQRLRTDEVDGTYGFMPASRAGRRMMRLGAVLAALAILGIAWALLVAHRHALALRRTTEELAVVVVATTHPEPVTAQSELILPGNVQANYEAPIYARTSGYLKRWLVDIGTPVRAGQLLAEIEAPEVDQQLRQAQADLATAEANSKIAAVTAERWRHLRASDSVSKQEADEKISAAEATEAQVQAARANMERLRDLQGFEKIVAPFEGVITARDTDVGQLINAGSGTGPELFRIADMHRLRLYVRVPQTDAAAMRPGLVAQLHFPDRPDNTYSARLERTSSAIDAGSRTLLAELIVDNRNNELLPGAYVEVHFEVPAAALGSTFRLPANVLLFRGDGLHVATVDPRGRVVMKPVTIGRDYGTAIEIVQGVSAEDQVVLSPPDSLTQGTVVRIVTPTKSRVSAS